MRLPVRSLRVPAILSGKPNGKLPASSLTRIRGVAGAPDILLAQPAARGFQAMHTAAAQAGHRLWTSSVTNSYRPYHTQESIFLARYYPSIIGTRWWNGRRWRKKVGVAAAAVPGTSNHGWGLALDFTSLTDEALRWLIDHAHTYGYSAEIQSEPWHWRWFAGDDIPAAVLEHERQNDSTGGATRMMISYGWFTWLNEGWRYRALSSATSVAAMKDAGVPQVDLTHGDDYKTIRALLNEAKTAGRLVQSKAFDDILDKLNEAA